MTSQVKKFVVITEQEGASVALVIIPAHIAGDNSAELEYTRKELGGYTHDTILSEQDGRNAAKLIFDELTTFQERHTAMLSAIKEFILDNYGESELENPSYDLDALANHLVQNV